VEIDDSLKVPHLVWAWDFVDMYLTHLGIRIQRGTFHIYLRKRFFWTPKDSYPPWAGTKKAFFSILKVMILQIVRNESLRFGRNIDIEVTYKILWLEVPKLVLIFTIRLAFKKGCLEAVLSKNTLRPLGVNHSIRKSRFPRFIPISQNILAVIIILLSWFHYKILEVNI
jgi:hypothetical protein